MMSRVIVLSAVLVLASGYLATADRAAPTPIRSSLAGFPMSIGGWMGREGEPFDAKVLAVLGVDEHLNRIYSQPGQPPIGLYVGYHESQRQGDAIHSPLNCLPGAGWEPVSKSDLSIVVPRIASTPAVVRTVVVNRYVIRKGVEKQVVLYWYQSQGRVIANEYWSKIYMVLDAVRSNRTDAALVRVIAPVRDSTAAAEAAAEKGAVAFIQGMFPMLGAYLPS